MWKRLKAYRALLWLSTICGNLWAVQFLYRQWFQCRRLHKYPNGEIWEWGSKEGGQSSTKPHSLPALGHRLKKGRASATIYNPLGSRAPPWPIILSMQFCFVFSFVNCEFLVCSFLALTVKRGGRERGMMKGGCHFSRCPWTGRVYSSEPGLQGPRLT